MKTICSGKMFTIWRGSLVYGETDLRISTESVSDKMFTIWRCSLYRLYTIWRVYCTSTIPANCTSRERALSSSIAHVCGMGKGERRRRRMRVDGACTSGTQPSGARRERNFNVGGAAVVAVVAIQ